MDRLRGIFEGTFDGVWIVKPFTSDELRRAIRRAGGASTEPAEADRVGMTTKTA